MSGASRGLVFENWNGRDALARTLGFCPSLDDLRMYQSHRKNNDRWSDSCAQQLYRRHREQLFLSSTPSVDSPRKNPEENWPLRQNGGDMQAISIITGTLICKVNTQTGEFEKESGRVAAPYRTGDDHNSPKHLAETSAAVASLLSRLNFDARMEPDPDDIPKGPLDALPADFFPRDDGSVAFQSGSIAALHSDFSAEAHRDHLTQLFTDITSGCTDYRVWMARAFAAIEPEISVEAEEEAQTLLRCIGITVGMDKTRDLLAETWVAYSSLPKDNRLTRGAETLLQAMYGSTFFSSVFFNLEDLRPETLELSGLVQKYPGLLWCE